MFVGEGDRSTGAVHLHVHLPGLQAAAHDVDVPARAREGDAGAGGGHAHDLVTLQTLRGRGERKEVGMMAGLEGY